MPITKYDDNLFAILKECKTLPVFFDVIFGFLRRRTDFYCVAENIDSPIGLPPGAAERIVRQTFYEWLNEKESSTPVQIDTPRVLKQTADTDFTNAEFYNGAVHEKYSWSQTIGDVDIIVKIPENITSKQLCVDIGTQNICVKIKSTGEILMEGNLSWKIKPSEIIWSIDKQKLSIHLEKALKVWWDCLIVGEEPLDVSKIDCSRPLDDLPDEALAKIEELTWNQERKRLGLPTSDQIDLEKKLKEAWGKEGSPFSGPFDPNSIIMN